MVNKEVYIFSSVTCSPCRMLKPLLTDFCERFDVPLTVYDMDSAREEFIAHNVRGVPTILIVEDGKEVDRVIGHQTFSSIEELFKKWGLTNA